MTGTSPHPMRAATASLWGSETREHKSVIRNASLQERCGPLVDRSLIVRPSSVPFKAAADEVEAAKAIIGTSHAAI